MSSPESPQRPGLLPRFTLKDNDTFLLADALADVQHADDGMFTSDTRVLSRYELRIAGHSPSRIEYQAVSRFCPFVITAW